MKVFKREEVGLENKAEGASGAEALGKAESGVKKPEDSERDVNGYYKLDPKMKDVWITRRVLTIAILGIITIIYNSTFFDFSIINYEILGITVGKLIEYLLIALVAYKVLGAFVYPKIEYKQWRYLIDEEKIAIRHGIFFVSHTVIPISRIQHVSYSQGMILGSAKLVELEISLASGTFEIPGIRETEAEEKVAYINSLVNKAVKKEALEKGSGI